MYSGKVEVWSSLMMAGGFAVLYKLSCSCLCLNLQTEQGRATSCCSWDVKEDTVTLIAHVLLAKQRKSKPVAALFEARNSEQEVFLACSNEDLWEGTEWNIPYTRRVLHMQNVFLSAMLAKC